MNWLEKLPSAVKEQVKDILLLRQRTLEMQQAGTITRSKARRMVAKLNHRIERLADRSAMNEYIPCKRRDPTAWEAIGRVRREEKEHRKRETQEKERHSKAKRSKNHARV